MKTQLHQGFQGPLLSLAALLCLFVPNVDAQGRVTAWGQQALTEELSDITQIVGGENFYLALTAEGTIQGWGVPSEPALTDIPKGDDFVQVAACRAVGLALRADGSIASWGTEAGGLLENTPIESGFVSIVGGGAHALAMFADGSIIAWGADGNGQVLHTPTDLGFVQIAATGKSSLALRADGSIEAWGFDGLGVVSEAPTDSGFVKIATGLHFAMALDAHGELTSWGQTFGVVTPPPGPFIDMSAGVDHAIALRQDGTVVTWSSSGVFDNSHGLYSGTPTESGFVQLATTFEGSAALRADLSGQSFCAGDATGSPCDCLGFGGPGEGCMNTTGSGARLRGLGNARHEHDTFHMQVTGVPNHVAGMLFQGSKGLETGNPFGDGLLCVMGMLQHSQVNLIDGGVAEFAHFAGSRFGASSLAVGTTTYYQFIYRDVGNRCSGAGYNYSNGWSVAWEH